MKGILAILMASIMMAAMVAPAMGTDANTSANVGNADPVVCAKWEEPDEDSADGTQVIPNATGVKTVTIKACVHDDNGNDDIDSVAAVVTGPGSFSESVTLARDTTVDPSCTGDCIGYSGTFDMDSCDPAGTYTVVVTVTDQATATGTMENTFEYLSLIAMTAGNVGFGNVAPGGNSTATSTVTCTGNAEIKFVDEASNGYDNPDTSTPIDGIIWSDMISGENTILDDQISTTWTPATTITCGNTANVPFKLDVPSGTPPGTYAGTITFAPTAV